MDEIVIVVESAKGEASVRSTHKGVITGFSYKEGDDVKIGDPMFELDTEAQGASQSAPKAQAAKPTPQEAPKPQEPAKAQAAPEQKKAEETPKPAEAKPAPATPAGTGGSAVQGDRIHFSGVLFT